MVGQVAGVNDTSNIAAAKQSSEAGGGFSDLLAGAVSQAAGVKTQSTDAAWQPPWMASAAAAGQYLMPADTPDLQLGAGRPSLAEFVQATGAGVSESVEALYGSIGSNKDYRDWTKIMAADDPLLAARQATRALYNSTDLDYAPASATQGGPLNAVARAGNFAYLDQGRQKNLTIIDNQGRMLRNVNMDSASILHAAEAFGLDLAPLSDLADQLDAAGVGYKPGQLYPGSDAGVDLRDLAAGGLGASYDWRIDRNVGKKGAAAAASLASDVALASRLGLTQNLAVTPPTLPPPPSTSTVDPATPTGDWKAPWMEGLEEADQYLLPADTPIVELAADRPTLAAFMAESGAGREESVEAIYGSIGSNLDYRDWNKIMAADDPLNAARQATYALYKSDLPYPPPSAVPPDPANIVAKSGNFAWIDYGGRSGLYIVDSHDNILRGVNFDAPSILRTAQSFGLDLNELNDLATQMDQAGVKYLPGQLYTSSDAGVDLRDLAAGGLGSSYDWRYDPNAGKKGALAAAGLASDANMAARLGITRHLRVSPPPLTTASGLEAAKATASFGALLQLSQAEPDQDAA